jgi:hypothetical protein
MDSDPRNFASQWYVGKTGDSEDLFLIVAGHLEKKRVGAQIGGAAPEKSDNAEWGTSTMHTGVNSMHGYPPLN